MDDQMILDLKAGGRSLRQIASTLNVSHEAVRKRLRNLRSGDDTPTKAMSKLAPKLGTSARPQVDQSAVSRKATDSVNSLSTLGTLPLSRHEGVNPLQTPPERARDSMKRVSQGVPSGVDGLVAAIKAFLEANRIRVYPLRVGCEAYQASHKDQVLRIYVSRRSESHEGAADGEDSSQPLRSKLNPRTSKPSRKGYRIFCDQ